MGGERGESAGRFPPADANRDGVVRKVAHGIDFWFTIGVDRPRLDWM
jgi:hypothetical protein